MSATLICPDAFISPLVIEDAVAAALAEDLGRAGDVTSIATVPADTKAVAKVVARKGGTITPLRRVAEKSGYSGLYAYPNIPQTFSLLCFFSRSQ